MATKFLHVSDLHLNQADRDYSLGVLEEIIDRANVHSVQALIMTGDMFDSLPDLEALRGPFREITGHAKGSVFFLPGNHEELGAKDLDVAAFDLGKVFLLASKPFGLRTLDEGPEALELLSIPHQENYTTYPDWPVPPKQTRLRIALAHGTVLGMVPPWLNTEQAGGAIDPDLFRLFLVDFAALGHLHGKPENLKLGDCTIAYAGSSRVWRKGESGQRGGNLVQLEPCLEINFVPFDRAGQYYEFELPLNPDGTYHSLAFNQEPNPQDFICIALSGVVENEHAVGSSVERIKNELRGRVRKIEIDSTSKVLVLETIASEPAALDFIHLWEEKKPNQSDPIYPLWLRARMLGLAEVKERLQNRR